ncbi:N-acetylmuramoyl-L-alanine amidase, partial [Streptomyces coelicoflavus]|nr:N-acetylmuramoyl-L-alanine amidase [Streptomyces coelicoflavus]
MVPPGGTPHIADRADPPDSRTMPVFRGPRRARERRTSRIPGAAGVPAPARALLGALPGLAAVAALFLCANGVQRAADAQSA